MKVKCINWDVIYYCLNVYLTYYWFIWAMLASMLIVYFVHRVFDDSILIYVVILMIFLVTPDYLNIGTWKFMYPFFVFGYFLNAKRLTENMQFASLWSTCLLAIVWLVMAAFYKNEYLIYNYGIYVTGFRMLLIDLYRYLIGFAGSLLFLKLCCSFKMRSEIIQYIGKNTLPLYFIDCLINSYVFPRIRIYLTFSYLLLLTETIVIVCGSLLFILLVKKNSFLSRVLLGN